jgi:Spx/MgsR family transcriptional regulator
MPLTVYHYPNCSTCRRALKWLDAKGISFTPIDITRTPPSKAELTKMLAHLDGDLRRLFNTSGQVYRELKIKDRLKSMTPAQAVGLLSENGRLIKRPFVLSPGGGLVGFREQEWSEAFRG